ncbi:MAG: hypothetical protein UCI02_06810 [Bifidobacterium criceti]|nr:hypothetical protein [Bifidobacterium criceti]
MEKTIITFISVILAILTSLFTPVSANASDVGASTSACTLKNPTSFPSDITSTSDSIDPPPAPIIVLPENQKSTIEELSTSRAAMSVAAMRIYALGDGSFSS